LLQICARCVLFPGQGRLRFLTWNGPYTRYVATSDEQQVPRNSIQSLPRMKSTQACWQVPDWEEDRVPDQTLTAGHTVLQCHDRGKQFRVAAVSFNCVQRPATFVTSQCSQKKYKFDLERAVTFSMSERLRKAFHLGLGLVDLVFCGADGISAACWLGSTTAASTTRFWSAHRGAATNLLVTVAFHSTIHWAEESNAGPRHPQRLPSAHSIPWIHHFPVVTVPGIDIASNESAQRILRARKEVILPNCRVNPARSHRLRRQLASTRVLRHCPEFQK